ncbi:MAG: YHS domain-containing (seleno)protein [Candidatus Hydrogenedentota bacterium]
MITIRKQASRAIHGEELVVRWRIILIAIVLAFPVAYVLSIIVPEGPEYGASGLISGGHPRLADAPSHPAFAGDGPINMNRDGVAIKGYDAVGYFTENEAVKGSPDYTAEYKDTTFWFASPENRDMFAENPEAYAPAYGGFCSLGVSNGYKDDVHPEAFNVIDGRLYFNLTPGIHVGWLRNKEQHITRADENWPDLRHAPGYGPRDAR